MAAITWLVPLRMQMANTPYRTRRGSHPCCSTGMSLSGEGIGWIGLCVKVESPMRLTTSLVGLQSLAEVCSSFAGILGDGVLAAPGLTSIGCGKLDMPHFVCFNDWSWNLLRSNPSRGRAVQTLAAARHDNGRFKVAIGCCQTPVIKE